MRPDDNRTEGSKAALHKQLLRCIDGPNSDKSFLAVWKLGFVVILSSKHMFVRSLSKDYNHSYGITEVNWSFRIH